MQKKIQESLTDCSTRSDGVPTENENENDTNGDVHPKPPPQDNDDEEHLKEQESLTGCSAWTDGRPNENENDTNGDVHPQPPPQDNDEEEPEEPLFVYKWLKKQEPSAMLENSNTSPNDKESGDSTMESDNKSNKSENDNLVLNPRPFYRRSTTIGIMWALMALALTLIIVLVVYAPQTKNNANNSNVDAALPTTFGDPFFTTFDEEVSTSPSTSMPSVPPTQSLSPSEQPSSSAVPSTSLVPSLQPTGTPSLVPSSLPSLRPSGAPSAAPSTSRSPSRAPTGTPSTSLVPSLQPTGMPSLVPSSLPSLRPSRAPSVAPSISQAPSLSFSPTLTPIDPNYDFRLRLYWERGYFWQESTAERWWCMECTVCDDDGTGDGWESGCNNRGDGSADNCRSGDLFWVKPCQSGRNTKFNVVQTSNGDQMRLDGTDLCLDRRNRYIKAQDCDASDPDQLWVPISDLSKFELRPLDQADWDERDARCASQHHHPKSDEIVSMHDCRLNRIYETLYWEDF